MATEAFNPVPHGRVERIGFFDCTRVGFVYGQDESERVMRVMARTCHIHFSSLKLGSGTTARASIDYIFREGDEHGPPEDPDADKSAREQADKAAELECTVGDRERLEAACDRIAESASVRQGRTAERFLVMQLVELPGDSTSEKRREVAEALVGYWEDRGHPAVAAVHGNGMVQPHVHVHVAARPVSDDGAVDRSVRLWTRKQDVRDERQALADLVNEVCPGSKVLFHGGRHEDVHIDREARKKAGLLQSRLPRRAQYRPDKYEFDEKMPGRVKEMHERGRAWRDAEAAEKKAEKKRKAAKREARRTAQAAAEVAMEERREKRKKERERRAAEQAELRVLNEKQTKWLEDVHRDAGRELPDLTTEEGQSEAWTFLREQDERQKGPREPAAPPETHTPAIVEPAAESQPESGPTPSPAGSTSREASADPPRPYAKLKENQLFRAYHVSRKAGGPQEERDAMRAEAALRRGRPEAPYAFHYLEDLGRAWRKESRLARKAGLETESDAQEAIRGEAGYRSRDNREAERATGQATATRRGPLRPQ